jgi:addiction module HigA family antidote
MKNRKERHDMVRIPTHRPPTHPGEMLEEEFLRPLGITQTDFADHIGVSFQRINTLVRGKRGITPDTALRLERALGMSADFWMDLQLRWDLWQALHGPQAEEIGKIEQIPELAHA